jgi:hypothetical protein
MKKLTLLLAVCIVYTVSGQDLSTPLSAFEEFRDAAGRGDSKMYAACTTARSQDMFKKRPVNPAQLADEYADIGGKQIKIIRVGNTATVYLLPENPRNPPYLLTKENGRWKVDLFTMSETIYFDDENNWHPKND